MIAPKAKRNLLYGILDNEGVETAIIFCNRKTEVRDLCLAMRKDGFDAGQIHGDMDQTSRLAELERFKSGEINILCASDVAARGLDIKGVSHVVNYDIPWHPDDYIHRIGRTGRAGATGVAITFVTNRDQEHVDSIEKLTGMKLPVRDSKSVKPEKKQGGKKPAAKHSHDKSGHDKSAHKKPNHEKQDSAKKSPPKKAADSAPPVADTRAKPDRPRKPKAEQPQAKSEPVVAQKPVQNDAEADGWNGPVPGFLDAKLDR